MNRHLIVGLTATGLGLGLFTVLAITGMLRHPQSAAEHTPLVVFLAIGDSLLFLTVGVITTFLACIELPETDG